MRARVGKWFAAPSVTGGGILCALVFLACYVAAWPVAQMGFGDDFSYIESARVYAQTGHFVYNGWAAAMLGWMIPWGALFIKLFGFSFMTVKLSMLPPAVVTLLLFHAMLRRFEISPRNAVIGTLTLGLSPLFLPLSASFMTDIPGLLAIVLCLYLCGRALTAKSDRDAMAWVVLAAASNVAGGAARQIAWLGVLVMVPCTGWVLRKRRGVLATALLSWAVGAAGVVCCMHWFARQPYSIPTRLLPQSSGSLDSVLTLAFSAVDFLSAEMLFLLFLSFPVLASWLPSLFAGKAVRRSLELFCVAVLPLALLRLMVEPYDRVWPVHIAFTRLSILHPFFEYAGDGLMLVLASVGVAGAIAWVVGVRRKYVREPSAVSPDWRRLFWVLVPFSLCYFALLLPIVWQETIFDKCMMGVLPCTILGSLWLYERCVGARLPNLSIGVLVVFGILSIAGTHDRFAWQRAQVAAIHELRSAGVPRTEIEGGFDYDGWTQVQGGGYLNDARIEVPKGAYRRPPDRSEHSKTCNEWFLDWDSDIHPQYTIRKGAPGCFERSGFPAVRYRAWLPPFERTVEVQRVPAGD